jgi:phosphonate transport system ATP-binding protein
MRAQIELLGVTKRYPNGVEALRNVTVRVYRGEFLAVIGLSGSGKSTLLRCINRLVEPSEGRVYFEGEDVTHLRGRRSGGIGSGLGWCFSSSTSSSGGVC